MCQSTQICSCSSTNTRFSEAKGEINDQEGRRKRKRKKDKLGWGFRPHLNRCHQICIFGDSDPCSLWSQEGRGSSVFLSLSL